MIIYICDIQGPYTYSLNSPHFYINQNSGTVFTKNVLFDYEVTKSYTLTVDVTDSGGRTSHLTAKVSLSPTCAVSCPLYTLVKVE